MEGDRAASVSRTNLKHQKMADLPTFLKGIFYVFIFINFYENK
jgi:hypothetical protein